MALRRDDITPAFSCLLIRHVHEGFLKTRIAVLIPDALTTVTV